jgi:hypothetical protein
MSMFANAQTIIRWLKMTKVNDCGEKCLCAKNLRNLYVTRPTTPGMEYYLKRRTEHAEDTYKKCFDKTIKEKTLNSNI